MWENALLLSVCAFLHLNLMINIYRMMRDSRASEDAGSVDFGMIYAGLWGNTYYEMSSQFRSPVQTFSVREKHLRDGRPCICFLRLIVFLCHNSK